jgi:hypothetical protein
MKRKREHIEKKRKKRRINDDYILQEAIKKLLKKNNDYWYTLKAIKKDSTIKALNLSEKYNKNLNKHILNNLNKISSSYEYVRRELKGGKINWGFKNDNDIITLKDFVQSIFEENKDKKLSYKKIKKIALQKTNNREYPLTKSIKNYPNIAFYPALNTLIEEKKILKINKKRKYSYYLNKK